MPTFGGASIASGYTSAALAGAEPRHPVVDTSSVSFPLPPAAGPTHYAVSPLQTRPAALGSRLGTGEPKGETCRRKKAAIITARMTPQTKAEIQHRAKQAGMTITDYLVTCALGKEIIQVHGLDEILSELKAQGRNLNQLTTLANMGRIQFLRSNELIDRYADLYQRMTGIARG